MGFPGWDRTSALPNPAHPALRLRGHHVLSRSTLYYFPTLPLPRRFAHCSATHTHFTMLSSGTTFGVLVDGDEVKKRGEKERFRTGGAMVVAERGRSRVGAAPGHTRQATWWRGQALVGGPKVWRGGEVGLAGWRGQAKLTIGGPNVWRGGRWGWQGGGEGPSDPTNDNWGRCIGDGRRAQWACRGGGGGQGINNGWVDNPKTGLGGLHLTWISPGLLTKNVEKSSRNVTSLRKNPSNKRGFEGF